LDCGWCIYYRSIYKSLYKYISIVTILLSYMIRKFKETKTKFHSTHTAYILNEIFKKIGGDCGHRVSPPPSATVFKHYRFFVQLIVRQGTNKKLAYWWRPNGSWVNLWFLNDLGFQWRSNTKKPKNTLDKRDYNYSRSFKLLKSPL
jgi:hypothetical protein